MFRFLIVTLLFLMATYAKAANQINSIKAFLYYDKTAEWSTNILKSDFYIWNAVIGEGSLKYPAESTLFLVEADSESADNKISVSIKQKWKNKEEVLVKGPQSCTYDKWDKKLFCPVVLPKATVGVITFDAEIIDQKSNKIVSRKSVTKEYGGGE